MAYRCNISSGEGFNMGDMIKDYKEINKVKKKEKVARKEHSMELLKKHSIPFQVFNNGIHVRVLDPIIEFYPTTGKWIVRSDGKVGFGIDPLLQYLGVWRSDV